MYLVQRKVRLRKGSTEDHEWGCEPANKQRRGTSILTSNWGGIQGWPQCQNTARCLWGVLGWLWAAAEAQPIVISKWGWHCLPGKHPSRHPFWGFRHAEAESLVHSWGWCFVLLQQYPTAANPADWAARHVLGPCWATAAMPRAGQS